MPGDRLKELLKESLDDAARFVTRYDWFLVVAGFLVVVSLRRMAVNTLFWLVLLSGAFLVGLPVWARKRIEEIEAQRRQSALELVEHYRTEFHIAMGDFIVPICRTLAEIAEAGDAYREPLQSRLRAQIVGTAAYRVVPRRGRALLYELTTPDVLNLTAYEGRSDSPKERIIRGEAEDSDHFFADLEGKKAVSDTELPAGKVYRSYVSVPVVVGTHAIGLLNVDSPEPKAVGEPEVAYAKALARLLAAGLAVR